MSDEKLLHLQGGSVSCDSSNLVDPLKIGVKSNEQKFSEESLRGIEKLVSQLCFCIFSTNVLLFLFVS